MMKWLRDKVMWLRLTIIRCFLSRKKQESVAFVKGEFLQMKFQKKKLFTDIFDRKLIDTEEGSVKQYGGL